MVSGMRQLAEGFAVQTAAAELEISWHMVSAIFAVGRTVWGVVASL